MKEFVESLETPRRILLMVKAGAGTDAAIDSLKPYLEKAISLLMAVTPSSVTQSVAIASRLRKVLTLSVPVFPVVKRAR